MALRQLVKVRKEPRQITSGFDTHSEAVAAIIDRAKGKPEQVTEVRLIYEKGVYAMYILEKTKTASGVARLVFVQFQKTAHGWKQCNKLNAGVETAATLAAEMVGWDRLTPDALAYIAKIAFDGMTRNLALDVIKYGASTHEYDLAMA